MSSCAPSLPRPRTTKAPPGTWPCWVRAAARPPAAAAPSPPRRWRQKRDAARRARCPAVPAGPPGTAARAPSGGRCPACPEGRARRRGAAQLGRKRDPGPAGARGNPARASRRTGRHCRSGGGPGGVPRPSGRPAGSSSCGLARNSENNCTPGGQPGHELVEQPERRVAVGLVAAGTPGVPASARSAARARWSLRVARIWP